MRTAERYGNLRSQAQDKHTKKIIFLVHQFLGSLHFRWLFKFKVPHLARSFRSITNESSSSINAKCKRRKKWMSLGLE